MPYTTEDFIHLPNPDHPESDFRLNNKGQPNIVGTTNFGAGVQARLGLLKGSGKSAVFVYLFDKTKFTLLTANDWLDKHKGGNKTMDNDLLTNKRFKFNLPLIKSYTDKNDGYLYLEYALATTDIDLENEQLTSKCLERMADQATNINMYMDHKYTDETTLGPVVEASIHDNQLWVKGRVRKSKTDNVKDILDAGTYMGGSFGGICQKDYIENGRRMLDDVKLLDATFTPMPANTATSGSARVSVKDCTVCSQIFKSIEHKYGSELLSKATDEPPLMGGDDGVNKAKQEKEEFVMDDESIKQFGTLLKENNKEQAEMISKAITEALKPQEPPKELDVDVKAIDEDKITENVTKGVLKALGIEVKEEKEPEDSKIVIMDAKGFEDMQSGLITKTVLELAKARQGTRKSKSAGGGKFEPPGEPTKEEKTATGKVNTRKAAESIVEQMGIPAA